MAPPGEALFVLAIVLDTNPADLVDPDDSGPAEIVPDHFVSAEALRDWLAGRSALPGVDPIAFAVLAPERIKRALLARCSGAVQRLRNLTRSLEDAITQPNDPDPETADALLAELCLAVGEVEMAAEGVRRGMPGGYVKPATSIPVEERR